MNNKSITCPANKNLAIKVIGIGGAGHNLVRHLGSRGLGGLPCAVINTAAPSPDFAAEFFPIEARQLRELDVVDHQKCEAVLEGHEPALRAWCAGADMVFVIGGLGGKAGSGLSPVASRIAKATGALVLGFATMPFDCEGRRRQQQAHKGLAAFRAAADGVVCLPNQKICKLIDEHTSLFDTFRISNDLLADGVRGVWQLLSYHGLMEIHFEDLCALLRDGHSGCMFATADAAGAGRARDAVEKLLAHPLLDDGCSLANASSTLVSLVAGPGLTMGEVNRVMESINRHCEGAQVLMGAAVDAALGDRLSVTVITACRPGYMEPVDLNAGSPPASSLFGDQLLNHVDVIHTSPRFVPPPPPMSAEKMEELASKQTLGSRRSRRSASKMRQEQLPLEIHSRGRFEKSEPTIRNGEDLDEPTYIRRGLVLN